MKVLKIENNKGYYLINDEQYEIDTIDREKIYSLLQIIYNNEQIDMDELSDTTPILNEASKVIYKGMYDYFSNFIKERESIRKDIEEKYFDINSILEDDPNP